MARKRARMYVQLGKRYMNGRIAKAENYDLGTFFDRCIDSHEHEKVFIKPPSKWDKFWKTKNYRRFKKAILQHETRETLRILFTEGMVKLINQDEYGRKTK